MFAMGTSHRRSRAITTATAMPRSNASFVYQRFTNPNGAWTRRRAVPTAFVVYVTKFFRSLSGGTAPGLLDAETATDATASQ